MDEFIRAVSDARTRLTQAENRSRLISIDELRRRSGTQIPRATIYYHLDASNSRNGHVPPPELVSWLASVLPVTESELMRAAQAAAGLAVVNEGENDPIEDVKRYLERVDVSDDAKRKVTARLADIVASQVRKSASSQS